MKIFLTFLTLLFSITSFCQDIEMSHYLNVYRKHHEEKPFKWSEILGKSASNQLNLYENKDSIIQTNMVSEIAIMGSSLPSCNIIKDDFIKFIKNEFGLIYTEPKTNNEVAKLVKLYAIYLIDKTPNYRKILLSNYNLIGYDFTIKDITYVSNTVTIDGKTVELKKFIGYYEVKYFFVFNLQK